MFPEIPEQNTLQVETSCLQNASVLVLDHTSFRTIKNPNFFRKRVAPSFRQHQKVGHLQNVWSCRSGVTNVFASKMQTFTPWWFRAGFNFTWGFKLKSCWLFKTPSWGNWCRKLGEVSIFVVKVATKKHIKPSISLATCFFSAAPGIDSMNFTKGWNCRQRPWEIIGRRRTSENLRRVLCGLLRRFA